jgi:hypothetical protein
VSCYGRNQPLVDRMWDRLLARVRGYPRPLRLLASELVRTLGTRPRRYFSGPDAAPILHLPIWLAGPSARRGLPDLIEATALAYLYVRIQDNVLDEPTTRGHAPHLLLANLLLADAMRLLAGYVDEPRFWDLARSAWAVFSAETESERRQVARMQAYPPARFRRHARKVALARIPLYAVLAKDRRLDKRSTAQVDAFIDLLGEGYGLVNDVLGCPRDLAAGTWTYLLATAASTLARSTPRNPETLRHALAKQPIFERFLERAIRVHVRALPIGQDLGIREMSAFTEERRARITTHLHNVTTLRLAMALASHGSGQ